MATGEKPCLSSLGLRLSRLTSMAISQSLPSWVACSARLRPAAPTQTSSVPVLLLWPSSTWGELDLHGSERCNHLRAVARSDTLARSPCRTFTTCFQATVWVYRALSLQLSIILNSSVLTSRSLALLSSRDPPPQHPRKGHCESRFRVYIHQ